MARKIIILSVYLFFIGLFGCVPRLSVRGAFIDIAPDITAVKNCKSKGVITGSAMWGWSGAHDAEGALNELRNKAANLGANTVLINDTDSGEAGTTIVGTAFECPKSNN